MGGPSAPLTPLYNRRTVYGKVSRYKLDDYLQLFDFPSPNLSAEKRFTTTVPLQRLFFMNSDFMQQQGELLARRVAPSRSADNRARIQKAYRLIFGRAPTEAEVKTGVQFLTTEPLKDVRRTQGRGRKRKTKDRQRTGSKDATADRRRRRGRPRTPKPDGRRHDGRRHSRRGEERRCRRSCCP